MKLLYFVTEDWYFCSHRLSLARAAQNEGYEVWVVTRVNQLGDAIRSEGFNLIPININRGGLNPFREFKSLLDFWMILRQVRPDILHNIALKPVLYGGLASLLYPNIKIEYLIAGLGSVFFSAKLKARLVLPLVKLSLKILFNKPHCKVIVQNDNDKKVLTNQLNIPDKQILVIKGSGVDTHYFKYIPEPLGKIKIALVSRLLWEKGVGEYIDAVKLLKKKGMAFDAFLVGQPDEENLSSINAQQLKAWSDEGIVQWLGYKKDIAQFWQDVHIAVLPSFYGEGVPKSLIEAAACGRVVVTTDTPGCNEIVQHGINGFLVPARDVNLLAEALEDLILDAEQRKRMGLAGRKIVEQEFSEEKIIDQTLDTYRQLIHQH